jgi:predicted transcriptional regulator of viral defense system
MNYSKLEKISPLIFTSRSVAAVFDISEASAAVQCTRYVKNGLFLRIRRGYYILASRISFLSIEETFQIANILQVPSYISFTTALSYYGISTQVQQDFCESAALVRTRSFTLGPIEFRFKKIQEALYNEFKRLNGIFIASPDKAFIDALYAASFGKYHLDVSALDLSKLDISKCNSLLKKYPKKTRDFWKKKINA